MRATSRYKYLSKSKSLYLNRIIERLYKNVLIKAQESSSSLPAETLLIREDFLGKNQFSDVNTTYERLYGKYINRLNIPELSRLVDELINVTLPNSYDRSLLVAIRVYLILPYINFWCPLVEFAHETRKNGEGNLFYAGSQKDSEFRILREILSDQWTIKTKYTFSAKLLDFISCLVLHVRIIKNKVYRDVQYTATDKLKEKSQFNKTVVISIQEERRFPRVLLLCQELERRGIGVFLFTYSILPSVANELGKYPGLSRRLILGSSLLKDGGEAEISKNARDILKKICGDIKSSGIFEKSSYRDVFLHEYAWSEVEEVIMNRGVQLEVCTAAIKELLSFQKVDAYIAFDTGLNTCAWTHICKQRSIPSFINFYNATRSPLFYKILADSFHPTAWLVGGDQQMNMFRQVEKPGKFYATGDLLLDLVAKSDRQSAKRLVRKKANIELDAKTILLLSSYVTDDFTLDRKKSLFIKLDRAAQELGVSLIVKAHPNEHLETLSGQMRRWSVHRPVFFQENLLELLFSVDLVCMYLSEAAQQAMSVGVPVLSIMPEQIARDRDNHWEYFSSGAVAFASLESDVREMVQDLIFNLKTRDEQISKGFLYIRDSHGETDGNNSQRTFDIISRLM